MSWIEPNRAPDAFGTKIKTSSTRMAYTTQQKLLMTFTTPIVKGIEDDVLVRITCRIVAIGDA
ncbi:hypothetical protein GQ600_9313 [Phytophthora cactorum]|nr:hypothetical protein GQ600_9313 [Phytophthora cactorum]